MMSIVRSFLKNQRGVAAVEFAIIAPIMIVLLLGTFETSLMLRATWKATSAAQTIADLVAQQTNGVTDSSCGGSNGCGSLQNFCAAANLVMAPFATNGAAGQPNSFSASVVSVTNSSGNAAVDWESDVACNANGSPLGATAVSYATAPIVGGIAPPCAGGSSSADLVACSGDSVIVVRVTYVLKLAIPLPIIFTNSGGIYTLQSTTYARPRGGSTVSYST